MSFLKKYKYRTLAVAAVVLIAAAISAFALLGNGAEENGKLPDSSVSVSELSETKKDGEKTTNAEKDQKNDSVEENFESGGTASDDEKKKDAVNTEKAVNNAEKDDKYEVGAEKTPKTEKNESEKDRLFCTISVNCATILDNMDALTAGKAGLVPKDGVILSEREAEFFEGESVFNLLLRETKKNKIHMEFHKTPVYNSAYIEGINNIYEFDCGELSGWMYRVNGEFPSYGCSRYILKAGDRVEWIYTCDLGADIGGAYVGAGAQNDE